MDPRDLNVSRELLSFISSSPSAFHTVATIRDYLDADGFTYLPESQPWNIHPGGAYYTVRNNSSLIAFKVGEELDEEGADAEAFATPFGTAAHRGAAAPGSFHFQIAAVHGDSPSFKLKAQPQLTGPDAYQRLNVEAYGGPLDATWTDRPLSLAGRALVKMGNRIEGRLADIDRDLLLIPNLAIHMNPQANKGVALNRQVDLCPLFSAGELSADALSSVLCDELGISEDQLLSFDLILVNRQAPVIWGAADEFVSAPRLDDLQGVFSCLKGFLAAENDASVNVLACFDSEEVGSGTKQGALSTFLADTLKRVTAGLGASEDDYHRALAQSFLVSCDNAHAVHPNHPEKTDDANRVWLNRGVVVKEAANQKYTTDAFSRAVFCQICDQANVPYQLFANRSDSAGGSTLGNLSNMQVSVHAVDIGLPQLSMHSAYETAGSKDTATAIRALTAFFAADIRITDADAAVIE